jgi:BolA protein
LDLARTIHERLAALEPERIELLDESGRHVGHEGAKDGGSHFRLTIVSRQFAGLDRIARHRLVYGALGALVPGKIHALAITAHTPEEAR